MRCAPATARRSTCCPWRVLRGRSSGRWRRFLVDDIAAKVDELRDRGVEFMAMSQADGDPFTTDERGVAAQEGLAVAWMVDPDGQVLTLFELT
jgi:hypothetical protein